MGKRKKKVINAHFFDNELDELNTFCLKHSIPRNDFVRQAVSTALELAGFLEIPDPILRQELTREEIKKLWENLPKMSKAETSDLKMSDERAEQILNALEQIKVALRKQGKL